MSDKAHEARIQKLEESLGHALSVAAGLNGHTIQAGSVTLVAGTTPAPIAAVITATSRILVGLKTPVPGAGNLTVNYAALGTGRVIGNPGTFTITALLAAGTINVLDLSTVDWLIIN